MVMNGDASLALFCDFENIALGVRDANYAKFDIQRVIEQLLVKGSIVAKKAYCDWDRFKSFKPTMHEAAFELIEIPHTRQSGKNSADIRMVVDALDLCYTKEHIDTFVIISGDSDFSPLVSKLRENAKSVIGVGVKNSTSDLLMNNCDEFIFYDDLVAERKTTRRRSRGKGRGRTRDLLMNNCDEFIFYDDLVAERKTTRRRSRGKGRGRGAAKDKDDQKETPSKTKDDLAQPAIDLVLETVEAIYAERGDRAKLWGSMIKQTLRRRRPGFNESFHGFGSFNDLLEEAQSRGLLELEADERSGGYIVKTVPSG